MNYLVQIGIETRDGDGYRGWQGVQSIVVPGAIWGATSVDMAADMAQDMIVRLTAGRPDVVAVHIAAASEYDG